MCQVVIYENPQCRCRWLQICQQCKPNAGFSQCDKFGKRGIKYPPDEYESLQCPIHDLGGWYDRNFVRAYAGETAILKRSLTKSITGMIIKETSGFSTCRPPRPTS